MAGSLDPKYEAILTPQEKETVQFAHHFFGARAKIAAFELGVVIGLDDQGQERFIDGIALRLEELNAVEREEAANHLTRLTTVLGGVGTSALSETADLGLVIHDLPAAVPAESSIPTWLLDPEELLPGPEDRSNNGSSQATDAAAGSSPEAEPVEIVEVDDELLDRQPPLSIQQKNWLSELFGYKQVDQIEQLPIRQRLELAANIGQMYRGLRISRLTPEKKQRRAEQLVAFMAGKSYGEIGRRAAASPASVAHGLVMMTESINKRVTKEDIATTLPKVSPNRRVSQPLAADRVAEDAPDTALSAAQTKWLLGVLGWESFDQLLSQVDPQRAKLANAIAQRLSTFLLKKEGAVRTQRRVQQAKLFIQGNTYEHIAEELGQPVGDVKKELFRSAESLGSRLNDLDRASIIAEVAAAEA